MQCSARRPWSIDQAAQALFRLACAECALCHVLLGWLPKLEDVTLKLEVAELQYEALRCAVAIHKRARGLRGPSGLALALRESERRPLIHLDMAADAKTLLGALYHELLPRLLERYRDYQASSDPISDCPSLSLIGSRVAELSARRAFGAPRTAPCPSAFAAELARLCSAPSAGAELPWDALRWEPLDRVPRAARPAGLERCEPGSLGLLTVDSVHEPRDVGIYLHSDLDEELTTLELVGRNSYEHPRMPEAFHVDMSRQASDEARHARSMLALMQARGLAYGDLPINTTSYDGLYAFAECEIGSEKELLWRMLIRQTFMEGLALDSLAHDIGRRSTAGQHDIAEALGFILSDEIFHAASGLRWCRHLLGDDAQALLQARYEALLHHAKGAEALRARFVEANPEKAMGELVTIEEGKRRRGGAAPERPLNRVGRQQAGFSEEDILQVLSWGYATE